MVVIRHVPRQEDIYGFIILQIGRFCENILEILVWIKTVSPSCFDDAESDSACFGARWCVGKQPVLSADDEQLDTSLCTVIVNLKPAATIPRDYCSP